MQVESMAMCQSYLIDSNVSMVSIYSHGVVPFLSSVYGSNVLISFKIFSILFNLLLVLILYCRVSHSGKKQADEYFLVKKVGGCLVKSPEKI